MKLLVTGGCGFLGSHVCEHFKKKGYEVTAYDNMTKFETSTIKFGNQELIRNYNWNFLNTIGVETVKADIRDAQQLMSFAKKSDIIINCAAQPTMTLSEVNPTLDFETNVVGVTNLLEAARTYDLPLALCSSIHVYGTGINDHVTEQTNSYAHMPILLDEQIPVLTGQITPLHASKRCAEIYGRMYNETYGTKVVTFRLTGIYGERQFGSEEHGWVSLLAIKTMLGLPIQIIGTGKQVRDILYVTDAVQAFDKWLEAKCPPGIYNIGGGLNTFTSVIKVIKKLSAIYNTETSLEYGAGRRGDLLYFVCDTKKAHKAFNWEPTIKVDEGLQKLASWLQTCKPIFNV